jgi:peptidoglycan hydrolase-like protein with peptidoglycan-binding domain
MRVVDRIIGFVNTAQLASAAYDPSTPYTGKLPTKTVKKGSKGTNVKRVQKFLNWCIKAKLKVDGSCGKNTVAAIKKFQKRYKLKVDGVFGSQSRAKAKKIVAAHQPAPAPTPIPAPAPTPAPAPAPVVSSAAQRIVAKATEYAYPLGTSKKKYSYKTGKATAAYKKALKKYMGKKAKISQSDCGYFVSTCVRAAGVSKSFNCLQWKKAPSTMSKVWSGKKIPDGFLQPGDIIRYKKSSGQHTMMYYGNGYIAEGQRGNAFPKIKKDTKKYNKSNVKKSTIQVLRAK